MLSGFQKSCGGRGGGHKKNRSVPFKESVVYSAPFKCGFQHLAERASNAGKGLSSSELVSHVKDCRHCHPIFKETCVLFNEKYPPWRLFREAVEIYHRANYVSKPSLSLLPSSSPRILSIEDCPARTNTAVSEGLCMVSLFSVLLGFF